MFVFTQVAGAPKNYEYLLPCREALTPDLEWGVDMTPESPKVVLTEKATGYVYEMTQSRAPKARVALKFDNVLAALHPQACECGKQCTTGLNPTTILDLRKEVIAQGSEDLVTEFMAANIRRADRKFVIGSKQVCRGFYAKALGVGLNKVKKARTLANAPVGTRVVRSRFAGSGREPKKSNHAYAFWDSFFDQFCQRPHEGLRLFPVNKSFQMIYDEHFAEWWKTKSYPECEKPGFSLFKQVRWDSDFAEVKRRRKHHHCRCKTCHQLSTRLLNLNGDVQERRQWEQDWRVHNDSVDRWHKLESSLISLAQDPLSDVIVLQHDATQAFGLPRCQHRPIKNLTKTRFNVVPWLVKNHGTGDNDYVYTAKGRYDKGANHMITTIHALLRSIKSSYGEGKTKHMARRLVVIADNASDNKNNEMYAYCNLLVQNGWFDSVELLFGEVGHTHNGVDAVHKIHNVDLGGLFSADFGQLVFNYPSVWSNPLTRPRASVLDVMYDWKKWLAPCMRKVSGFTNTPLDEPSVRGWRFQKNTSGIVEMKWKLDPAVDTEWRGLNGLAASDGFHIFKYQPQGMPELIAPATDILLESYRTQLKSRLMIETMTAEGTPDAVQYNYEAAQHGEIKKFLIIEEPPLYGEWGGVYSTGSVDGRRGQVRFIEKLWDLDRDYKPGVFGLPLGPEDKHILSTSNAYHPIHDAARMDERPLPYVRVHGQSRQQSGVYDHPNNILRRNRKRKTTEYVDDGDGESEENEAGDWHGEGDEEYFEVDFNECAPKLMCAGTDYMCFMLSSLSNYNITS